LKRKAEIAFSFLMVLVFAFAVYEARGWRIYARLLPWVLGFPMLALALAQLALDIRKRRLKSGGGASEVEATEIPAPVFRRRTLSIMAWLLGLFLAIWLLGFMVSIPLFTFLYLKIESGESWWFAILLSAVTWGFMFGLFQWALNLPFPPGLLMEYLFAG
jgi:hypothetical protein